MSHRAVVCERTLSHIRSCTTIALLKTEPSELLLVLASVSCRDNVSDVSCLAADVSC